VTAFVEEDSSDIAEWPSRPAELKHGPVSRAQLADVAEYAGAYRVAHPLGMNG